MRKQPLIHFQYIHRINTSCTGAADQIEYTYRKLGGDVLDIELSSSQVFAAYQEAVLEYSYLLNIHQAKNVIGDLLGAKTGSFDEEGQLQNDTDLEDVALKFPKFRFEYARRVGHGYSTERYWWCYPDLLCQF